MVDTATIISIVIAVVSFLGTIIVAFIGQATARDIEDKRAELEQKLDEFREKRQEKKDLAALTAKYAQPLMVAAYELQARLYELLEYPISKEHLEMREGLEDIKIFTCYSFARFLAWTHILQSKTQYFSFTTDKDLKKIGDLILRLNEEFDRRRGDNGENVGVWPGPRHLISERMIKNASHENDVPLDTIVSGYNVFLSNWKTHFMEPMAYFCQWIDDMVMARKIRKGGWDSAMRATQHNLVDMVQYLDRTKMYSSYLRKVKKVQWFCDCVTCNPEDRTPLRYRGDSRHNDQGLRPWYVNEKLDRAYDEMITLEPLEEMTCTTGFNQTLAGPLGKNNMRRRA
ncbi:hypothetical protein IQ06DRAFT_293652 [Phaeosphaeriaceae sp. SRC1lsM3a]|nr:hypothetical protein IQ06DRAFT_293652 [Stagonospora sp. SRC1lsM3a]